MGFEPVVYVNDDGLKMPDDIGNWGIKKYTLVGHYCNIFTSAMKQKWDNLVYIDLFSCAGVAKIKDDGRFIKTSSLIAASVDYKFTHYISCDEVADYIFALNKRILLYHEGESKKFSFIVGDCNQSVDEVIKRIPIGKTLNFCFVDPYNFKIEFNTIKKLSYKRSIDFLILIPTHMAGSRNFHNYIKRENNDIEKFIDDRNWRTDFENGTKQVRDFPKFLTDNYDKKMKELGYLVDPKVKCEIKTTDGHTLYYLAFYSRHPLGNDFYKKITIYQDPQLKFF